MVPLAFHPLTPDRWEDLERLFGPERGGDSGCWCMFWRLRRSEFHALGKKKRKAALRKLVESGAPLGILAYEGPRPVGLVRGGATRGDAVARPLARVQADRR